MSLDKLALSRKFFVLFFAFFLFSSPPGLLSVSSHCHLLLLLRFELRTEEKTEERPRAGLRESERGRKERKKEESPVQPGIGEVKKEREKEVEEERREQEEEEEMAWKEESFPFSPAKVFFFVPIYEKKLIVL